MNRKINQLQNTYKNIIRFKEYIKYSQRINMITMLLPGNTNLLSKMYKIILNFSLKGVGFNKKKALSFFLAIEYLTNQKCIATLSTKNVLE
jgi:ribosomal protein L5